MKRFVSFILICTFFILGAIPCSATGISGSGNFTFYVSPGETVIEYGRTSSSSSTMYLEFRAPVSVEGYIKEGIYVE